MQKLFLVAGTVLAGLAVALGALGAHGLKKVATPETVEIYQTGVQYQMYHSLAILAVGLLIDRTYNQFLQYAGFLFIGGIVLFSGSLYLIASLKTMNKEIPKMVGILTPAGGLLFIAGWILLLIALVRK